MRKLFIFASLLATTLYSNGQSADQSINEAQALLKKKEYKEVIVQLELAKKEVELIYVAQLKAKLLPTVLGKYSTSKNNSGYYFIDSIQTTFEEVYTIEHDNSHKEIRVLISNTAGKMNEVISAYAPSDNSSDFMHEEHHGPETSEKIKIKDYRAILYYDDFNNSRLIVLIGAAVLEIKAQFTEDKKEIITLVNSIDFDQIIAHFGK